MQDAEKAQARLWEIVTRYLKALGPGLVTGASDDDPCGIGTYAQTGALLGYSQLWTAVLTLPLMLAVQEAVARIALQTGCGLTEIIRRHYARPVLYGCVLLLALNNIITIGADLGAMAAVARLLLGMPFPLWLLGMSLLTVTLEIFLDYQRYARVLRLLTLSLFAYVLVLFMVPQDWGQVLRGTLVPTLAISRDYLLNLVAVLGTTLSPYMFFWQASQEIEEQFGTLPCTPGAKHSVTRGTLRWMRSDVATGMFLSNLFMWCIIITAASTLHRHQVTSIDSAVTAARALYPIAGNLAALVFAAGIIGTGLLAVPVLAGSTAYAVAEMMRWQRGLYLPLRQAPGFYGVIAVSTLVGAAINFSGINPILALYYAAIASGLITPPLLVIIMLVAGNRTIMRDRVNGRLSNILGWSATVIMSTAALALLVDLWVKKL